MHTKYMQLSNLIYYFKKQTLHLGILLTILSLSSSCNKKNDNGDKSSSSKGPGTLEVGGDAGTVNFNMQAVNSLDIAHSQGDSSATPGSLAVGANLLTDPFSALPSDPTAIKATATSVISGPPNGFKIIVKEISFEGDEKHSTVFKSDTGVELAIEGAAIDLSAMIAASIEAGNGLDTGDLAFKAEVGHYKKVSLKLEKRAYIKGCIKGLFHDHYNETSPVPNNAVPLSELSGTHEYCTREGADLYSKNLPAAGNFASDVDLPNNSDFEKTASNNLTAEWMKIHLDTHPNWPKTESWYDADINQPIHTPSTVETEDYDVQYEVSGGFTIEKDKEITLTMLMDMNRLLRYDNSAKDHPRDFPTHRNPSFFFDTTFKNNSFVFVGRPGKIYGYEIKSLVCKDTDLDKTDLSNASCSSDFTPVNTWMTLITDQNGKPQSLNIQPEDDSRLTTLVGTNFRDGTQWVFAGGSPSTADILYSMDSSDQSKFRGTIYDFPANLETYTTDNPGPFLLYWDLHGEGDKDRAGNSIYPTGTTDFPYNKDLSGVAYFWRRL